MHSLIVGTAGHIDHGKSALVRALTGVDPDRLPEEKRRGITIDLGFADLELNELRIGFVDVPGHERFIRNMLAGAHGIDLVDEVMLALVEDEARELVDGSFLENAPVVAVSSRTGAGLDDLKSQLTEMGKRVPPRSLDFTMRLPIDR